MDGIQLYTCLTDGGLSPEAAQAIVDIEARITALENP